MKMLYKRCFQGAVLGASILIPGLSGGTMALLLGIYDVILEMVGSVFVNFKKSISFLLPIVIGAIVGFVSFSNLILFLLNHYNVLMVVIFSGVILGSIPMLFRNANISFYKKGDVLYVLFGMFLSVLSLFLPNLSNLLLSPSIIIKFVCYLLYGALLALALVLPGISFSMVMMITGVYYPFLDAIRNFNVSYIVPLIACVGLFTILFSSLLTKMFAKKTQGTYAVITGFVIVSALQMIVGVREALEFYHFIFLMVGFLPTFILQKIKL